MIGQHLVTRLALAVLISSLFAFDAGAQTPLSAKLNERWPIALADAAAVTNITISGTQVGGTPDQKKAAYRLAIDKLARDPEVLAILHPDVQLVDERVREADRHFIEQLQKAGAETTQANAANGASTNPAAGVHVERSGLSSLLALATDNNFLNADGTAVSVSLNALALYGLADPTVYSELYRYRQHTLLRRIGGTFVFGSRVPEKEISGISGFPDADKLLDAFTWDIKVRILGDRDPRSSRWYSLTLGEGALQTELSAVILSSTNSAEDLSLLQEVLNDALGRTVTGIKAAIARSPQLSLKASGTHVTTETGQDKYAVGGLFDVGLDPNTDATVNLLYSATDDVRFGAMSAFRVKRFDVNAAITTHFGASVFAANRSVDWNSGASIVIFTDKTSLPIAVENTWKLFTEFDIPLGDAARIPISVVYTNDGNALQKTKYVSGQIGISYDFSAIKNMFTQKQ